MAYIRATKLPDRYKVVFRNQAGARIRHQLTKAEFERKDRDTYVRNAYGPTGRDWQIFDFWFVPFIETFDTPSKDLEEGMVWEGADRHERQMVMWREVGGVLNVAKADEVIISRSGTIPETITRKPNGPR